MMNTKNACPFCGCHSTQVLSPHTMPNTSTHAKGYQIECVNCGARGPCGMATPADAANSWDKGDLYRRTGCINAPISEANSETAGCPTSRAS
jgi:transcription elongation factor Elf1